MKLGIISDIHEDLHSLEVALDIFSQQQCDELVCLGDILGYDYTFYKKVKKRDASECISIIKNNFKYVVIGNHDLYAIKKLPKQLNGFIFPDNWYKLSIEERRELTKRKIWLYENEELLKPLTDAEEDYLSNLPEHNIINIKEQNILLSHSVFPDITGSNFFRLHNPWELRHHFNEMMTNSISLGFSGHMHSKYLITADKNEFKQLPYKKTNLNTKISQYFCPCIANGKEKSGLVIVDFDNYELEAFEINNRFKIKIFSFNGKFFKKD